MLLVVGGKGVLVEQHQFCVIRACFRKLWKFLSDGSDQAGLSLHPFVVRHRHVYHSERKTLRKRPRI